MRGKHKDFQLRNSTESAMINLWKGQGKWMSIMKNIQEGHTGGMGRFVSRAAAEFYPKDQGKPEKGGALYDL